MKPWVLAEVVFEDEKFIHSNLGSYFTKDGAEKEFTLRQGKNWLRGDSIDEFC